MQMPMDGLAAIPDSPALPRADRTARTIEAISHGIPTDANRIESSSGRFPFPTFTMKKHCRDAATPKSAMADRNPGDILDMRKHAKRAGKDDAPIARRSRNSICDLMWPAGSAWYARGLQELCKGCLVDHVILISLANVASPVNVISHVRRRDDLRSYIAGLVFANCRSGA